MIVNAAGPWTLGTLPLSNTVMTYVAQNSRIVTLVRPSVKGPPKVMEGSPFRTKKSSMNGTADPTDII